MGAVFVHLYPFHFSRIDIAGYMLPSVYHKTASALRRSLVGHHGAIQPSAYNQIIIFHPFLLRSQGISPRTQAP